MAPSGLVFSTIAANCSGSAVALNRYRNGHPLSGHRWCAAHAARGDLGVLAGMASLSRPSRAGKDCSRADQHPHGPLRAEQLDPPDAFHAPQFFNHVARQIVAQRHFVVLPSVAFSPTIIRKDEAAIQLESVLADHRRKPRFDGLDAVLHVHLRQFRMVPGLKVIRISPEPEVSVDDSK